MESLHPLILPSVNDTVSVYYTLRCFFIALFLGASPSIDPSFC